MSIFNVKKHKTNLNLSLSLLTPNYISSRSYNFLTFQKRTKTAVDIVKKIKYKVKIIPMSICLV